MYTQVDIDKKTKLQYYSAIRRTMGRTPLGIKIWNEAISQETGVRGGKLHTCYMCKQAFQRKFMELEHKRPVCDLRLTIDCMAWDFIHSRLNDEEGGGGNLGIICINCHKKLTSEQRDEKTRLKKVKKFLVCRQKMKGVIKVIMMIDLREFDTKTWEVIAVFDTKEEAYDDAVSRT